MTQLRDQFIKRMILRNMAPTTCGLYLEAVRGLAKYWNCSPDRLTNQHVQDYLYYLAKERNLAWSTIRTRVYGIKFFYHDFLGRDPGKYYIPSPKVPKKLPTVWSPQEIHAILNAAFTLKMQTMIKVAYGSGLRASEVVHLKAEDIDSGHMTLWVRSGKRRKDRAALLTPTLLHDLRRYWLCYRPESWLFTPPKHPERPLLPATFGRNFGRIKKVLGLKKPGRIHTFRHSFATHLIASGTDIYTVQKLLGHTQMSSTMVYVHMAQSMVVARASHLDLLAQNALKTPTGSRDQRFKP